MDKLKISVRLWQIIGAAIFKILFDILSIPVAFATFSPFSSLSTLDDSIFFKEKLESFTVKKRSGLMFFFSVGIGDARFKPIVAK